MPGMGGITAEEPLARMTASGARPSTSSGVASTPMRTSTPQSSSSPWYQRLSSRTSPLKSCAPPLMR